MHSKTRSTRTYAPPQYYEDAQTHGNAETDAYKHAPGA